MKSNETVKRLPKEYTADLASARGVVIEAEALPIEVKPVSGGTLRVLFTLTDESDITESGFEDGVYTISHRKKKSASLISRMFHAGQVTVELPEEFHGDLTVEGQNAPVSVDSLSGLSCVELGTINAPIRIERVSCDTLTAATRNAPIRLDRLDSRVISLETSNSPVSGTINGDPRDFFVESGTTNAKNDLPETPDAGQAKRLMVSTTNAPISVRFVS